MKLPIAILIIGFAVWVYAQPTVPTNKPAIARPLSVPVQTNPPPTLYTNVITVDLTSVPSNALFRAYTVLRSSNALTDFDYVSTFTGQTTTITDVTPQLNAYYQVVGAAAITARATNK